MKKVLETVITVILCILGCAAISLITNYVQEIGLWNTLKILLIIGIVIFLIWLFTYNPLKAKQRELERQQKRKERQQRIKEEKERKESSLEKTEDSHQD